jgi:hypothetical protein
MRVGVTKNGLTLRVIAGTHNAILGIDLQENKRSNCLGFSIQRTDLGPVAEPFAEDSRPTRWLPNMLRFPIDPSDAKTNFITTERSPYKNFAGVITH